MLQFHEGGESQCTSHPHPLFGKITPLEWGTGMYKHLDHHLKQFGVSLTRNFLPIEDLFSVA